MTAPRSGGPPQRPRRSPTSDQYRAIARRTASIRLSSDHQRSTALHAVRYLKERLGDRYQPAHLATLRFALDLPVESVWFAVCTEERHIPSRLVPAFVTAVGTEGLRLHGFPAEIFDADGWAAALNLWHAAATRLLADPMFPQSSADPQARLALEHLSALTPLCHRRRATLPVPLSHPLFALLHALCDRDLLNTRGTAAFLFTAADHEHPGFLDRVLDRHPGHIGVARYVIGRRPCPLVILHRVFVTVPARLLNVNNLLAVLATRRDVHTDPTALGYLRAAASPVGLGVEEAVQLLVVLAQCDLPEHRVSHLYRAYTTAESIEPPPQSLTAIESDSCFAAVVRAFELVDVSEVDPAAWERFMNVASPVVRQLALQRVGVSGSPDGRSLRRTDLTPVVPSLALPRR